MPSSWFSRFLFASALSSTALLLTAPAQAKKNQGVYGDMMGMGMFGIESTHEWKDPANCPSFTVLTTNYGGTCHVRAPLGIGGGARLGYNFGGVGLEGFGLLGADWSKAQIEGLDFPGVPTYLQDMQLGRVGGGVGGGFRFMTPDVGVRFSAGVGGGVVLRHIFSNVTSLETSAAGYVAPMLLGDLSLTIGGFFSLGAFAWVEFIDSVSITPDFSAAGELGQVLENEVGDVVVYQGPQVFIGPMVSLHFGE